MKKLFVLLFIAITVQAQAAKMSAYTPNVTPNADVYFIGVDPNDTTQTINGSNYSYSLGSFLSSGLLNIVASSIAATGVNEDATHRFVTDTEKDTWDGKADVSQLSTITPGSTTTKAAAAELSDVATTAKETSSDKTSGVAGAILMYDADGINVTGTGFIGPDTSSEYLYFKVPSGAITPGYLWSFGSVATTSVKGESSKVQTITPVDPTTLSVGFNIIEDANTADPQTMSVGTLHVETDTGTCVLRTATNAVSWAATVTPTTIYPELVSAILAANGTTLTLGFDAAVSHGSGYTLSDFNVDASTSGNDIGMTYVSGDTTDTHVMELASAIQQYETVDFDFLATANSMEDGDGDDLAAITSFSVTNNSTYVPTSYSDILFHSNFENTWVANKPTGLTATTHTLSFVTTPAGSILAGTYAGAYNSSTYDALIFPVTADDIFNRVQGRSGAFLTTEATPIDDAVRFEVFYDANNYVRFRHYLTTGYEILWRGQGVNYQAYVGGILTPGTADFVSFSYGPNTTDFVIYVNGVAQTMTRTGTLTAMSASPANGTMSIGASASIGGCLAGSVIDQWINSNDKTRDLNAVKTVTNFN
jgi:hypothetical protein